MKYKIAYLLIFVIFILPGCGGDKVYVNGDVVVPEEADVTYSKGNANAEVVVTEFSEYECPFCSRLTLEVIPQLEEDYIETGKILFVFKDFPIPNHEHSVKSAEAAYCAGEQAEENFWLMHIKLFENHKKLTEEDLVAYANEIDLNIPAFKTCLNKEKYKPLVLRNRQEGLEKGVNATPTLFVNDQKIVGLTPYENLKKIIETELNK
jgi:protein-disulfide isomerase